MPNTTEERVERATCWIDREMLRKAKELAAREEKSLSEVLEQLLRAPLSKRHARTFADSGNPVA